jgi:hypothetical protein
MGSWTCMGIYEHWWEFGVPTKGSGIDMTIMSVTKSLMDKLFSNSRVLTHFVMRSTGDPHHALKCPLQANTCAKKNDVAHRQIMHIMVTIAMVEVLFLCTQNIL